MSSPDLILHSRFKGFLNGLVHCRWPLLFAVAIGVVLAALILPAAGQAAPSVHPTDDSAPYVSSMIRWSPGMERTNSDTLKWAIVFSEGVANVDSSDFDVDGTTASLTVTSVSPNLDSVYFATLSGGDLQNLNGAVAINISSDNNIVDSHGNSLGSLTPTWNRNTYTVFKGHTTAPHEHSPQVSSLDADQRGQSYLAGVFRQACHSRCL